MGLNWKFWDAECSIFHLAWLTTIWWLVNYQYVKKKREKIAAKSFENLWTSAGGNSILHQASFWRVLFWLACNLKCVISKLKPVNRYIVVIFSPNKPDSNPVIRTIKGIDSWWVGPDKNLGSLTLKQLLKRRRQ